MHVARRLEEIFRPSTSSRCRSLPDVIMAHAAVSRAPAAENMLTARFCHQKKAKNFRAF